MRRTTALLVLLLAALLVLAGCGGATTPAPSSTGSTPAAGGGATTAEVVMKDLSFQPASLDVAVGASVTFSNQDTAPHTVTGEGWDSGTLEPGKSYTKTFEAAGTFKYSCTIHPSMTGVINVK